MRRKRPVTQNEYPLPEGLAIVSRTDLKGRIAHLEAAAIGRPPRHEPERKSEIAP